MYRFFRLLLLFCLAGVLASGCSQTNTPQVLAQKLVSGLTVVPENSSVPVGLTRQLRAQAALTSGGTVDGTAFVVWASSDPDIASVSNEVDTRGQVTGRRAGTVTITATEPQSGLTASARVEVTTATLQSLRVTPFSASAPVGIPQQFTATGVFSDGSTQDLTLSVQWSSSDDAVASVVTGGANPGLATGLSVGETTISARHEDSGLSASATFHVSSATVVGLSVTPAAPSVPLGIVRQFTATATLSDGTQLDVTSVVTWQSSDTNTAIVSNTAGSKGQALGLALGSPVTITATEPFSNLSATATLTLTDAVLQSIQVSPGSAVRPVGIPQAFQATGRMSDGTTVDMTSTLTWNSSDTGVATVDSSGLATGSAAGETTITATDLSSGIQGSATLHVTDATIVSLAVTPATSSVPLGAVQPYVATATLSDGTTVDVTSLSTWQSGDTDVATVSNSAGSQGQATALQVGQTLITATETLTGKSGSAELLATDAVLRSISVSPNPGVVAAGQTVAFTATGRYSNNGVFAQTATWSSSDETVATIDPNSGVATGIREGQVTITATDPATSISGSTTLVVKTASVQSLRILPVNPTSAQGTNRQFRAIALFTDGSQADLTSQVQWQSGLNKVSFSNVHPGQALIGLFPPSDPTRSTTISATLPGGPAASTTLNIQDSAVVTDGKQVSSYKQQWRIEPSGNVNLELSIAAAGSQMLLDSNRVSVAPHGRVVYVQANQTNIHALTVDPSSAALGSPVGTVAQDGLRSHASNPDPTRNYLYVASVTEPGQTRIDSFEVDPETGLTTRTVDSESIPSENLTPLVVDPLGRFAYLATLGTDETTIYPLRLAADGSLSVLASQTVDLRSFALDNQVRQLLLHPNGRFLVLVGSHELASFAISDDGSLSLVNRIGSTGGPHLENILVAAIASNSRLSNVFFALFNENAGFDVLGWAYVNPVTGVLDLGSRPSDERSYISRYDFGGVPLSARPVDILVSPGGQYLHVLQSNNQAPSFGLVYFGNEYQGLGSPFDLPGLDVTHSSDKFGVFGP